MPTVVVGVAPTVLCEAIKGRKNLRFQAPTGNTNPAFIKHDRNVSAAAGPDQGIEMPPNSIISLDYKEDHDIEAQWYGIVAAGTEDIIVDEVM